MLKFRLTNTVLFIQAANQKHGANFQIHPRIPHESTEFQMRDFSLLSYLQVFFETKLHVYVCMISAKYSVM
jgi:hypothetical protein